MPVAPEILERFVNCTDKGEVIAAILALPFNPQTKKLALLEWRDFTQCKITRADILAVAPQLRREFE